MFVGLCLGFGFFSHPEKKMQNAMIILQNTFALIKEPELHHSLWLGYGLYFTFLPYFMVLTLLSWRKQIFMQEDAEQQLILCPICSIQSDALLRVS